MDTDSQVPKTFATSDLSNSPATCLEVTRSVKHDLLSKAAGG